jgi:hypothetical protein
MLFTSFAALFLASTAFAAPVASWKREVPQGVKKRASGLHYIDFLSRTLSRTNYPRNQTHSLFK